MGWGGSLRNNATQFRDNCECFNNHAQSIEQHPHLLLLLLGPCSSIIMSFHKQLAAVALGFHHLQLATESNAVWTQIEALFLLEFGKWVEQDFGFIFVFTFSLQKNCTATLDFFSCFLMSRFSLEVWLLVGWASMVSATYMKIVFYITVKIVMN